MEHVPNMRDFYDFQWNSDLYITYLMGKKFIIFNRKTYMIYTVSNNIYGVIIKFNSWNTYGCCRSNLYLIFIDLLNIVQI